MKEEILGYLKEQKDFRSGEEISKKLGVTRAAVWKAIKKLQADGYRITSSTKKGYKLIESPNLVTPHEISEILNTKVLGKKIYYFEEVGSTNNEAKALCREWPEEGTLVIAEKQSGGKGRLGRTWESPSKTGIWMSLVLCPEIMPQYASQITLIAGLGMCEAIKDITGLEAKIKWPNDIVVNGKKICGILTEMSAQVEAIDYIVVGIGVNVNMTSFPEELPYASSLALEGGKSYSRREIVARFLQIFEKDYEAYKQKPDLEGIIGRYEANCITLHQMVKIISRNEEMIAKAEKINKDGTLVIKMTDGTVKQISSGEVSVRGLYGYT